MEPEQFTPNLDHVLGVTVPIPDSWRQFSPAASPALAAEAERAGQLPPGVRQLVNELSATINQQHIALCAFGSLDASSSIRGAITLKLDPNPDPKAIPDTVTALCNRSDVDNVELSPIGSESDPVGYRVSWRTHSPSPSSVCAEYFVPSPTSMDLAILGASALETQDPGLLGFADLMAADLEFLIPTDIGAIT